MSIFHFIMNAASVPPVLGILTLLAVGAMAQESPLAKPLQKFDLNKDGKLTGEELVLARQAHNRGGKELEFDARRMREFMDRRKQDWKRQQNKFLDENGDGKIDEAEERRGETVWAEIAKEYEQLRKDILRKYDRNDDGDLTGPEREASRAENNRRRNEIEQKVMDRYRESAAKPASPPPPAPATPG
jgi:Ca2+-binding EF-hand superfamily protein